MVEFFEFINEWGYHLLKTRPTAANLRWAVTRQLRAIRGDESQPITSTVAELVEIVKKTAIEIADEDVEWCKAIGQHGLGLIRELSRKSIAGMSFNILTHCNAGEPSSPAGSTLLQAKPLTPSCSLLPPLPIAPFRTPVIHCGLPVCLQPVSLSLLTQDIN